LLNSTYDLKKSVKFQEFWKLEFDEFMKTLKVKLSLSQKEELLEFFEKHKKELTELDNQIQQIDNDIDEMVFDLYELTPEERQIVLDSTK